MINCNSCESFKKSKIEKSGNQYDKKFIMLCPLGNQWRKILFSLTAWKFDINCKHQFWGGIQMNVSCSTVTWPSCYTWNADKANVKYIHFNHILRVPVALTWWCQYFFCIITLFHKQTNFYSTKSIHKVRKSSWQLNQSMTINQVFGIRKMQKA